ncbi:MAG: pyrroloquinoline quinone-dependent dehydrogenase, partial [Woeseia sp.]
NYAADKASSKFVPLQQIDRANFSALEVAWSWCSPDEALRTADPGLWPGNNESTPIMIDGVLYTSTSLSQVAAIDAVTGMTLWTYDPQSHLVGSPPNLGFVNRGVSYWTDGNDRRIFIGTGSGLLIAVNADTGEPAPEFNGNGTIDLRQGLRRSIDSRFYGVSSAPLVCGDTVIVGSNILDFPSVVAMPPGDVRGFDARTGERRWVFQTVPQPGEFGNETWENNSWQNTGGANVWTLMSCDENLGYVYLPVSTPTNDYYGGDRPGDNLFAESLVALDAVTGQRIWHFQMIHHGIWDYDLPAAPNLVDIIVNGRPIQAVAQVSKQAFTYVFDRVTGEPVWPIVEQPVPASTISGEVTAPTQPVPSKPPPFDRQGVTEDDLIDFTPELRQEALAIIQGLDIGPLYTPPTARGTIILPGIGGGANWSGAAVNPESGLLYVPSWTNPFILNAIDRGLTTTAFAGDPVPGPRGPRGLPLFKPPYGRVTAIDLNTGDHVWMSPVGEGFEDEPPLAGLNLPPLGLPVISFVLATRSLLFVAQGGISEFRGSSDRDNASTFVRRNFNPSLKAYDLDDGSLIGEVSLPGNASGAPISYMADDIQYVVVPIGGSSLPAQLVALRLPQN